MGVDDVVGPVEGISDLPGMVRQPSVGELPAGYAYGVTRYADLILRNAFPERFNDLVEVLGAFRIDVQEILKGGGSRASHTRRFDALLEQRGWGKRTITISKLIDDQPIPATRGHEIDMFAAGAADDPYPGVAVEMEWNNKDPFFDRDLLNFMALHREGALAVGIIVTRGPQLQRIVGPTVSTGAHAEREVRLLHDALGQAGAPDQPRRRGRMPAPGDRHRAGADRRLRPDPGGLRARRERLVMDARTDHPC